MLKLRAVLERWVSVGGMKAGDNYETDESLAYRRERVQTQHRHTAILQYLQVQHTLLDRHTYIYKYILFDFSILDA